MNHLHECTYLKHSELYANIPTHLDKYKSTAKCLSALWGAHQTVVLCVWVCSGRVIWAESLIYFRCEDNVMEFLLIFRQNWKQLRECDNEAYLQVSKTTHVLDITILQPISECGLKIRIYSRISKIRKSESFEMTQMSCPKKYSKVILLRSDAACAPDTP